METNNTTNSVEFDGEKSADLQRRRILYSRLEPSSIQPKIIQFLIARHFIKNEKQGDILLIVILISCVVFSAVILKYSFFSPETTVTKDAVLKILTQQ